MAWFLLDIYSLTKKSNIIKELNKNQQDIDKTEEGLILASICTI